MPLLTLGYWDIDLREEWPRLLVSWVIVVVLRIILFGIDRGEG